MSYTFSLSRRSLPVRCLCLLLIVLVLWCFFMIPRAGAVAVEAATVAYAGALVGTILVGAGVIFSSHGDMQKVGAAMYKSWVNSSNAIGSKISAIAAWAVEHGEAAAKGALRVGKELYQSIVDAFNASYNGSEFPVSSLAGKDLRVDTPFSDSVQASIRSFWDTVSTELYWSQQNGDKDGSRHYRIVYSNEKVLFYYSKPSDSTWRLLESLYVSSSYTNIKPFLKLRTVDSINLNFSPAYSYEYNGSTYEYYINDKYGLSTNAVLSTSGFYFLSDAYVTIPQPDLKYPSNDYLVKMPDIPSVDVDTGEAVFPSDAAYTKDAVSVPYPTDADGVKVPDIPYDQVVDQSTGKALDDTGTDTDNPSKPGEDTGTDTGTNTGILQQILDLLKNFFDSPSDFRLNMDGFRNLAIKDKFPFCIPFDMVNSVKQFAADAADYQFHIKLDTQYFKVDHVVDLTPLAVPLAFFRYLVVAWFAWVLMSRTHDLIKW